MLYQCGILDRRSYYMDKITAEKAMREMTLLLMYLSRFNHKDRFAETENMAWKGYDFDVLNQLADDDLIRQEVYPSKTKLVWITPDGLEYAKELLDKYNICDWKY